MLQYTASSCGVPSCNAPSASSHKRSAVCRAVSRSCVERRIVLRSSWARRCNSNIKSILPGKSRKAVGSSSSITGVCCASDFAIITFCISPSLRVHTRRSAIAVIPTLSIEWRTMRRSSCRRRARRCSVRRTHCWRA